MKLRREAHKKPEKERSTQKENNELKRENQKLRRELSRLRKQVTYLLDVRGDGGDEPSDEHTPNLAGSNESMPVCDACGSRDLATVDLPIGTLVICKSCKHRKKV
jgi:hypothetical protein